MTDYVILKAVNDNGWIEQKQIAARSAQAAIRAALDGADAKGTFVAVPARSWKPVTVTVETKTQLRFQ